MDDHDRTDVTDVGPAPSDEAIPLGQRLLDRPFLLLAFGLAVMLIFFTFWGLWEILSLPTAPLP